MRQARAKGQRGSLDTWDRKPDPIPGSISDFSHDLGQIPGAPDFQTTSVPFEPTLTWAESGMAGR